MSAMQLPRARAMGDYDRPGSGYQWRRLTPSQASAALDAMAHGVSAAQLAAEYGVCKRTLYRHAAQARQPIATAAVAGWRAEFIVTELGPVRCTPWLADPEDVNG